MNLPSKPCVGNVEPGIAQQAQERLGMLSDIVSSLRERDARGDDEAYYELEALFCELEELHAAFELLTDDGESGPVQQAA